MSKITSRSTLSHALLAIQLTWGFRIRNCFFSSTFAPNFISVETIVNNRRVSTYDMVNLSPRALDCSYSNKKELDVTS